MTTLSRPLALVGFKASGKTTVGRLLAERLDVGYVDTDAIIEERYAVLNGVEKTFRQIYTDHGADEFAAMEREALVVALTSGPQVVSFGGGTLGNAVASGIDLAGMTLVHLAVEKEALYKRMMAGGLPAFLDPADPRGSFDRYWNERAPLYESRSQIVVDNTKRRPVATADEIIVRLEKLDGR
jgi:shikimate kinase